MGGGGGGGWTFEGRRFLLSHAQACQVPLGAKKSADGKEIDLEKYLTLQGGGAPFG